MAKAKSASADVIGERLAGDREAAHVGARVAVGDAQLEKARRAQLAHQRPAFAVEILGVAAGEIVRAPALELVGKLAMPGFEEGPGWKRSAINPWNSGVRLAANAS